MLSVDLGRSSRHCAWVEGKRLQCNKYRTAVMNETWYILSVYVTDSIVGWLCRKCLLVHDTPHGCLELRVPSASNEER